MLSRSLFLSLVGDISQQEKDILVSQCGERASEVPNQVIALCEERKAKLTNVGDLELDVR